MKTEYSFFRYIPVWSSLRLHAMKSIGAIGLSTGITQQLGIGAKLLSIIIMYSGRLGPLTIVTVWYFSKGERVSYPEGNISVG